MHKEFQDYHITSPDTIGEKDFSEICQKYTISLLGKGFFSRAFRIEGEPWVIKEGRWDIDIPLLFGKKNIHGHSLQKLLSPFSYKFLPSKEESWRQYQDYLLLVRYFGYCDGTWNHYPDIADIRIFQQGLRSNVALFFPLLRHKFGLKIPQTLGELLPIKHNYLPHEYMCYGKSISPENKGRETSYIVQEYIAGTPFSETHLENFSQEERAQVYLLCLLILLFSLHTGKVPDTRPNNDPKHWGQWFMHTENIFSTPGDGIKMVDTRWLWDVSENLIKRGVIIPELILQSVSRTAKKIEKMYTSL